MKDSELSKIENLEILADAISDTGYWIWYKKELPKLIHLEFDVVQLYIKPETNDSAPLNHIAIQLLNPISVNILKKDSCKLDSNWLQDFENDKYEGFFMEHDFCSFEKEGVMEICSLAGSIETIYGDMPDIDDLQDNHINFGFWANDVGMLVVADNIRVLSKYCEIPIEKINLVNDSWWDYWAKYWDYRGTDKKFPYDAACEVTIPVEKRNLNQS